jgi:hypothetical protein
MPVTRNLPRVEFYAALRHLLRALVAGVLTLVALSYESDLPGLSIEMTGRLTWGGLAIVPIFGLLVGIVTSVFLVLAVRRISRWLTALKHVRMLKDPRQAALVPPLPSHLQPLTPTLGRRIWLGLGYMLFATAVMVVTLMPSPPTSTSDDLEDPFLAWTFAILLLLGSVYAFGDAALRWRRARRARQASRITTIPRGVPAPRARASPVERASIVPPLTVAFQSPTAVAREPRAVTAERNVFGRPPWNMAYLRLFDNEGGLQRFLKGSWRECGYVHFIRDVDSVSSEELRAIEGGARLFIDTREELLADLESCPSETLPIGERRFDRIAAEAVEVQDTYGSYPVYAALCHDSFWKAAVDILLERADIVLLDLSGYHWDNLGTGYELQRVIDRFPIERCVFLADPTHTDRPFLESQIQRAWSQMAAGSPNAGEAPRQVIVAGFGFRADITSSALTSMLQERLEVFASYTARVERMSALGAAEQARREAARQQALPARRGKPQSALRILLRLWGVRGL